MGWMQSSCLGCISDEGAEEVDSRRKKRRKGKKGGHPSVSAPLHLLLKADTHIQNHIFLKKEFRKPKPCHRCHKPITRQGSTCRVCKYICHKACESNGEATGRDGGEAKPALSVQSLRTEEQCLTASDSTGSRPAADGSVDQHAHNSVDEKKDPPSICEKGSPCINSTPPPSSPLPETTSPLNRASSSSPPSSSSSPPDSSVTTSKTSTSPDSSSPVLSDSTSPVVPDHPVATPPVTNPASTPVPSSLSPTHPSRFYSRFGDTSLQIHRQWMLSRRLLLPTPLPSDATTSSTDNPSAHNDEPVYKDCESSSRKMEANKHAGRSSESEGSDALGIRRRECALEAPLAEVEEGSRLKIAREEQQHQDARVASSGAAAVEGERQREGEIGAAEEVEGKLVSMELTYVTERIIALWFPVIKCNVHDAIEKVEAARERMLEEAISMLRIKHATNCMIFDLSIPREADLHRRAGSLGMASHSLGWQGTNLAPPLERLCSACKYIESWLSTNSQHVAVLYSRGPSSKERIGVVISAYLTYSGICGSEEQALDRFAMRRFFQDKIGRLRSPSNVRYVDHFSGLLSGGIRMNAEPLFLTHITIRGAPLLEESKVCLQKSPTANGFGTEMANSSQHSNIDDYDKHLCFFLKIYQQGLTLAYTSPVYELNGSTDRLTIALENTDTYPTASPLHLRGDVLLKGYYLCSDQFCDVCHSHGSGNSVLHRHVLFQCQFHTCAVAKHSLRFTTKELDEVEDKKAYVKYPPDNGALELRFSGAMEPWPCPTQSIPLVYPSGLSPESGYAEPSLSSAYYLPYADEEEEQFEVGSIVAWDSIEELCGRRRRRRGEEETEESWANSMLEGESASSFSSPAADCAVAEESGCGPNDRKEGVGHLSGPLDGSLYATVSKQPPPPDHRTPKKKVAQQHQQQRGRAGDGTREAGRGGMDRGSSPGGDSGGGPGVDARVIASRPRPGYGGGGHVTSPSSSAATFSESFRVEALTTSAASPPLHAQLDELLGDMLMTVENIPDLAPSPPPCGGESAHARGGGAIAAAELEAELLAERSAEGDRDEDIPYHARKDGRPFTYGAVPEQQQRRRAERQRRLEEEERGEEIVEMHARSELSSPGLVRRASSAGRRDGGVVAAGRRRFPTEGEDEDEKWRRLRQQPAGDDVSSTDGSHSIDGYAGLTWLQRQQQKLRDRREGRIRQERCPQEFSLLRELRTYQRCSSASGTQTLPAGGRWHGREDGYASDTSLPVGLGRHVPEQNGLLDGEDEWDGRTDGWRGTGERVKEEYREEWIEQRKRGESRRVGENFTLPLRINTAGAGEEKSLNMSSEPGSPLLPRRSISREATSRYTTGSGHVVKSKEDSTLRTIGSGVTMQSLYNRNECQVEGERPFVAVKRAHELQASGQRSKDSTGSLDDGMTGQVSQSRDDSFSSWATASVTWGEEEDDEETGGEGEDSEGRRNRGRPQTPAFPVQPRTPYSNGSNTPVGSIDHQQQRVLVEVNVHGNSGLPPKSPTTIRKDRSHMSVSPELPQQGVQSHRQPMMANGGSTIQRQIIPTTPPHSTLSHGSTLPRQQYGDHQEVSPAHVKFVRDTSRFWYKPTISREEAISILKDKQPGTFVVRDSNSFPGAFGLALKVATPPTNVANRVHSNTSANSDLSNELVRHFLIEPTSRGVKLKGCANEPVFSSLSALVYQHSLTAMALPCRLILPESEPTAGRPPTAADGSVSSNQILLQQGAACNVLYLMSVDTESLTGPQAVRRAVSDLFSKQPMPAPTVVHFKVSGQGITLTDNKRKLFFRRHYPVNTISHCGLDPDDHRWTEKNEEFGISISSNRCFGFVARKPSSKGDNQCHIFAELDPEQPATAIVNFVTRVMMAGTIGKTSNIV